MVRVIRRKNNDTKRKDVIYPYNTRSRTKLQKNYIHPKDNTSVSRSSNTVIIKDKPASGRPAKELPCCEQRIRPKNHMKSHLPGSSNTIVGDKPAGVMIPELLYKCVEAALVSRKEWETKRDNDSKLSMEEDESLVDRIAYYYKHVIRVLPLGWKYNPAIAITLVPSDKHPCPILSFSDQLQPYKEMAKKREDEDDTCYELPKIYNVPMKEDETESWLQFKKLDEGNPTPVPSLIIGNKFPSNINIEHPFVSVIGSFAFNGFNEAYKMFVSKGKHNVLSDPAYRECTYLRSNGSYFFNITIEAVENQFCCIYEAKVTCTIDNGERTLTEFSFTKRKQGKKGIRASKSKSSKGKKGHASKSKSWKGEDEDVREPSPPRSKVSKDLFEAYASRMEPNDFGGYDYTDPY